MAALAPRVVDKNAWYYEYPTKILLIHRVVDDAGEYVRTDSFEIPMRNLVAPVEKYKAKARARKRKNRA